MPSPGMVTTVCFGINANSEPCLVLYISHCGTNQLRGYCSRTQSQLLAYEILNSACYYQRLRHAAERREGELLARVSYRARRKIHLYLISGNDGLLLARHRIGKPGTQAVDEFRRLDAQKAVVEGVAQIGLREAARNHEWNALVFERGHRLLAAGAGAKVEAADNDVTVLRALRELRIVVYHHHARHHLRRHIFTIGVVLAIDAIGVQVVLRQEDQAPPHALRKPRQDRDLFSRSRSCGEPLEVLPQLAVGSFSRSADIAGHCGRGDDFRAAQIAFRVTRTHASFEIAIGGGDPDFARFKQPCSQADARSAS